MTKQVEAEFPRPFAVSELPEAGVEQDLAANAEERAALAARFGLVALEDLQAVVRLQPVSGGVRLYVEMEADVVQSCVVTLEPVSSHIVAAFDRLYVAGAAEAEDADADIDLSYDEEDPPEVLESGIVDVGEAVAEQLGLELDPFPRVPGATFDGPPQDDSPVDSPFAVLSKLTEKGK